MKCSLPLPGKQISSRLIVKQRSGTKSVNRVDAAGVVWRARGFKSVVDISGKRVNLRSRRGRVRERDEFSRIRQVAKYFGIITRLSE